MKTLLLLALLLPAAGLAAPGSRPEPPALADHRSAEPLDDLAQATLDKARALRVLFAHQSVGNNILAGLRDLARQDPRRYRLQMRERGDAPAGPGVTHFNVGANGDPQGKVAEFAQDGAEGSDVAMLKLCFVDIEGPGADPERVFNAYREALERLQHDRPATRFVFWTQPLAAEGNAPRNRFNDLVRRYARSRAKPLYDIADIESHKPDGSECAGPNGPALCAAYTDDGGHLSAQGRARAARAWWRLLAQLVEPGAKAKAEPVAPKAPTRAGSKKGKTKPR